MSEQLVPVQFHVNGRPVKAEVPTDLPLVDFLREELGLSGTRLCCGIGVCKACTVAARRAPTSQAQPMTPSCVPWSAAPTATAAPMAPTPGAMPGTPASLSPAMPWTRARCVPGTRR